MRLIGGVLTTLLVVSGIVAGGTLQPAQAADGASVSIDKQVNDQDSVSDIRPGATLNYKINFQANDDDADGPVLITDKLPEEFAGWEIRGLSARVNGVQTGLTLELPGVTSGPAPTSPVNGVLSEDPEELNLNLSVALPVFGGVGNDDGLGLPVGSAGVIEYTLVVPSDIGTDSPILRKDLVNTATITAKAGVTPLRRSDSATAQIDNPVMPKVDAKKTWSPAAQPFQAGLESTITVSATQASNIDVERIDLRDPADPALTPNGATTLPANNPFNYVDFAGFLAPNDPLTTIPAGVETVLVEVYYYDGTNWNWVPWDSASQDPGNIGGVHIEYDASNADIAPGTKVTQGMNVTQREKNRSTNQMLSGGWSVTNTAIATVNAGDKEATTTMEASFEAIATRVNVQASKGFYRLPDGQPEKNLRDVPAGETVGVVVQATNREEPFSTELNSLKVTEPSTGADAEYFGENLIFAGFDNAKTVWPTGNNGAKLTWIMTDGTIIEVVVPANGPLPAAPNSGMVKGFEVEFQGNIAPGAQALVHYKMATNGTRDFVADGQTTKAFKNVATVTGGATDLPEDSATVDASITLVAPKVTVTVKKKAGPNTVLPGQDLYVQLDTVVKTGGATTKPTEIIIEDSLEGSSGSTNNFWDAFDAKQVLPPITRPLGGDGTPTAATLTINVQKTEGGPWEAVAVDPPSDQALDLPADTIGVQFVYTHPEGLSQTALLKPNMKFTARQTLRSDPTKPTGGPKEKPEVTYENTVIAKAKAKLGPREVTSPIVKDKIPVVIRGGEGETGPVPGGEYDVWTSKSWSDRLLTSQSNAKTTTTQSWAVTKTGIPQVTLQDPGTTSASGEGTVFEAFNLLGISPIHISGSAPGAKDDWTLDPRLKWDTITDVQLFDGTDWTSVPAPDGSWMAANGGFKGYELNQQSGEHLTTLGVRLIVQENSAARLAAGGDPSDPATYDPTVPEVGSGIASSADVRSYKLKWQLRSAARTDGYVEGTPPKWVIAGGSGFNCGQDKPDCVSNDFTITGGAGKGRESRTSKSEVTLIDGRVNVDLDKTVRPINPVNGQPSGSASESIDMVVPNQGEVAAADFPRARYSLTAMNTSEAPENASGSMSLAVLRIADTRNPTADPVLIGDSQFAGRSFITEAADGLNPFAKVNVTKVSYGPIPDYIDRNESEVEVWIYDGTNPQGTRQTFTLQQVLDNDPSFQALLPNVIGVSTTFTGTEPQVNGNRIPVGAKLTTNMDVQLREFDRATGQRIEGGGLVTIESVKNNGVVRAWDAVVAPDEQPRDTDEATIVLKKPIVNVGASKTIAVLHGSSRNTEIYETEPEAPVRVSLAAAPKGSTAPISSLRIEDSTPEFWEKFELKSVDAGLKLPKDADTSNVQAKVGNAWVALDTIDPADYAQVRGLAVDFSRSGSNPLFPDGAASWSTSWESAALPFTVQLRADAEVNWLGDSVDNTVQVTAENPNYQPVTDEITRTVTFGPGTHGITVEKRAPEESGAHPVDPLASLPWQLVFKNTGNSYLPIEKVVDSLPSTLKWDWELPTYTSTPGPKGQGLTTDKEQISVMVADPENSITFRWPEGQRMYPGETMTITLNLALDPLPSGTHAINKFTVTTGVDLASCVAPRHGLTTEPRPTALNECANNNYVTPRLGTSAVSLKAVSGEIEDTLGENLVNGAMNTRGGECALPNVPFLSADYTRSPCASYTAPGATDTWSIQNVNTGSTALSRMVVVDMLPREGDRRLDGGASRGSTYKPVLANSVVKDNFSNISGLPAGAVVRIDVTNQAAACIGSGSDSKWSLDPTCENTTLVPENQWYDIDAGPLPFAVEDIAGVRFDIDMSATPLQPTGRIGINFRTINLAKAGTTGELAPSLESFENKQFAWNQAGMMAWDESGAPLRLPSSQHRAGVVVKTMDLEISKVVSGQGSNYAPDEFDVNLTCTVPSGDVNGDERVALDMGANGTVKLVKTEQNDGTWKFGATVPNIPIGADCSASEAGALGEYGESARSIATTPGVTPAEDGLSAEIKIREDNGSKTDLEFTNFYTVAGVAVQKMTTSNNSHPVPDAKKNAEYGFELSCEVNGYDQPIVRDFKVKGGALRTQSDIPEGARCIAVETNDGGALGTTVTINGQKVDGTASEEFVVPKDGVVVLFSNEFEGVAKPLPNTGWSGTMPLAAMAALLLIGGAAIALEVRNRKRKQA